MNNILDLNNKKTIIVEILSIIGIICIIGYTYSFFAATATNSNKIYGQVDSLNLGLTVNKIKPGNDNDLIPQLDDYIDKAVIGRQGNCIDDNGNTVCNVFQVTVKNNSASTVYVTGELRLSADNMPNLKWARITGLTEPQLLSNKNNKGITRLTTNEVYTKGETKDYYIVVWLSELDRAQTDNGGYTGIVTFDITTSANSNPTNITLGNFTANGTVSQMFPTGSYTVTPNCTNADVEFDYENNGFTIKNITGTGEVTCSPSFTSKTKTYLNQYIRGTLTGTVQGDGEVVNEIANIPDYSTATSLTQEEYGTPTMYSSTSYSSTSGTTIDNAFVFSDDTWSSVPDNLTSNTYYHFQVTAPSDGYYQLCYTLSSGSTSNRLYLYKNTTQVNWGSNSYFSAYVTAEQTGCVTIGELTTSDTIRVVQRAYTTIATVNFYLKKTTDINTFQTGYRYEGKNPNNYIKFNNELWRIIGVFDSSSHGQTGEYLTKIIRNDSIGTFVWSNLNIWPNSSLYTLLNTYYYNAQDGIESGYCSKNLVAGKCDWRVRGINDNYRPMVKNVTWYLGGYSSTSESATAEAFYEYERSTDDSNYYTDNRSYKTTTGYIGLMYASDYGYSVLSSSCARTTNLGLYNTNACAGNSWLFKEGNAWTITHYSSNYALCLHFAQFGQT